MSRIRALLLGAATLGLAAPAAAGDFGCRIERTLDSIQVKGVIDQCRRDEQPGEPVPEPGSALVFGAGLLVASGVARRRRQR